MRATVAQTVSAFGGIDIVVNHAGVAVNAPIEDLKFEDYEWVIAVNVTTGLGSLCSFARFVIPGGSGSSLRMAKVRILRLECKMRDLPGGRLWNFCLH